VHGDQSCKRSKYVAFGAFSCATVPVLSEGGPAKLLKNKNLSNHPCAFELGGRGFESLRARNMINKLKTAADPVLSNITVFFPSASTASAPDVQSGRHKDADRRN
jgi:hypothetical protein